MKPKVLAKNRAPSKAFKKSVRPIGKDEPLDRRPRAIPPRTVLEALEEDLAWVRENVDRLIEERGRVYVAVRDGQVFGSDDDENTLIMRLRRKYGKEGFLVVSLDDPRLRGEEEPPEYAGVIDEDNLE